MIENFLKRPKVAFCIVLASAFMFAYVGWKEIINPSLPPFKGKGAWLRSSLYDAFGLFGNGGFSLLMSFAFFVILILFFKKKKYTK